MKLPFFITDEDWRSLKPKEQLDPFGKPPELPPEQQKFLGVFRTVDLRVEWSCAKIVFLYNAVLVLAALNALQLIGFTGPEIRGFLKAVVEKMFAP